MSLSIGSGEPALIGGNGWNRSRGQAFTGVGRDGAATMRTVLHPPLRPWSTLDPYLWDRPCSIDQLFGTATTLIWDPRVPWSTRPPGGLISRVQVLRYHHPLDATHAAAEAQEPPRVEVDNNNPRAGWCCHYIMKYEDHVHIFPLCFVQQISVNDSK
jgi:hypothetical protein